jgi:hypothetical protein
VYKVVSRLDGCLYAVKKSLRPVRCAAERERRLQVSVYALYDTRRIFLPSILSVGNCTSHVVALVENEVGRWKPDSCGRK